MRPNTVDAEPKLCLGAKMPTAACAAQQHTDGAHPSTRPYLRVPAHGPNVGASLAARRKLLSHANRRKRQTRPPIGPSFCSSWHDTREFSSDLSAVSLAFPNPCKKSLASVGGTSLTAEHNQESRTIDRPALMPFGLLHEPGEPGNVGYSKVTPLAA